MSEQAERQAPLAERATRVDLAACYRLAERHGFSEMVWNHITARVPGSANDFLLNRFGLHFTEVTASNLIKLDAAGHVIDGPNDVNVTAYVIHSGIYAARKDVNCVMHAHSRAGLAVAALECGFKAVTQGAMIFHERLAYHDYRGLATDTAQSEDLARDLGPHSAMILRNHGLLTTGRSVAEAFVRMFYLEQSCQAQIDAMSCGVPLALPPPEQCEKAARQSEQFFPGEHEWPALLRVLDRESPDYKI